MFFTLWQMGSKWVCFPFDDTQAKQDLCLCSSDQENMWKRKQIEVWLTRLNWGRSWGSLRYQGCRESTLQTNCSTSVSMNSSILSCFLLLAPSWCRVWMKNEGKPPHLTCFVLSMWACIYICMHKYARQIYQVSLKPRSHETFIMWGPQVINELSTTSVLCEL